MDAGYPHASFACGDFDFSLRVPQARFLSLGLFFSSFRLAFNLFSAFPSEVHNLASGFSLAVAALSLGTWFYRPGMFKRVWIAVFVM